MEKLVLLDGNSLINRAFYAMPLLTTQKGEFTNAVYGFLNMFFKILTDVKPKYVAVAFDVHAPTFRHKIYEEYKGTRKPMPMELRPQIPLLKSVLNQMGVFTIEKAGLEADDIIGTLSKRFNTENIIFTGDRDSFQLVSPSTKVHFTKRGITDIDILDNSNFTEKTGIVPSQVIELKALMGDASDNIPGIPGVGEKTALTLIQTYGNIDTLYANTDKLSGKLQEKVINGKESCYLSKTLATIDTDCDIQASLNELEFSLPLKSDLKKVFMELEFKSLYNRNDIFSEKDEPDTKTTLNKAVNVITIKETGKLPQIKSQTVAFCQLKNAISLYYNDTEFIFPIKETLLDDALSLGEILKEVSIFLSGKTPIIVFDNKQLKHFLDTYKISLTAPILDLALVKYLTDFTGERNLTETILEYGKDEKTPAYSMTLIWNDLYKKLEDYDMVSLYNDVELPLSNVLYEMENSGFKVDENSLYELGKQFSVILQEKENKIRELSGDFTLNVNSPKQLGELLFNKLKIAKGKKTKTGFSTSAEILEELEDAHPIIPYILEYRKLQKLQSTYIEGLKSLIDKKTGLIHTSFNQTVTATGRLSSKEPNLQNIPVRDDEGKILRKFFVPKSDDRILVSADYSQIELRLLAEFSNCTSLINAFKEGKDIHAITASKVFKTPLEKVTKQQRSNAKAVNFGIIYGISEYGLSKQLKISPKEAKSYIDSYFIEYPEVKAYMDNNVLSATSCGYAKTFLGRRRYIRDLYSTNYNLRQFGERVAMNMPLQGSAADIIKIAMINVFNRLKKENLKSELILQIHDELIIDAFISEKDKVLKLLVEEMENVVNFKVKLIAESGVGRTWYETK